MRLADFIESNRGPILQKWEEFARTILPEANLSRNELRDHARQMLEEISADLRTSQTKEEQALKSEGLAPRDEADTAAETHADTRLVTGFTMDQMVSEYRALRASVLLLWSQEIDSGATQFEVRDIMRFNECIDQMLTESVARYSRSVMQANKLFLGILAHDLRTPLNAIGLGAELMLRAEQLESHYIKISSRIFESAKRAGKIVENLLDFTRANSGGLPLHNITVDLRELCVGIVDEVGIHHPDRTIVFESEGKSEGTFDATRIEQALCNLIENAVLHGAIDSIVTVTLQADAGTAMVKVHNNGDPIDARDLPHIFDPMTRYSQHAADERGPSSGLGLGLYIANQIVAAHHGKLEVKSDSTEGTTFIVKLPLEPGD